MKSTRIIAILCLIFIIVNLMSCSLEMDSPSKKGDVPIMFDYEKKLFFSTNQFAVWIEDTNGNVIKPLFVTEFTGEGGWRKRSDALPIWVDRIGKTGGIDTMTGSTPKKSGRLEYIWDCTDTSGNRVPDDSYVFFVEATFRKENRALFSGKFTLASGVERFTAKSSIEYFGGDTKDRGMIKNVFATLVQ